MMPMGAVSVIGVQGSVRLMMAIGICNRIIPDVGESLIHYPFLSSIAHPVSSIRSNSCKKTV